jgi:hypothetical protein
MNRRSRDGRMTHRYTHLIEPYNDVSGRKEPIDRCVLMCVRNDAASRDKLRAETAGEVRPDGVAKICIEMIEPIGHATSRSDRDLILFGLHVVDGAFNNSNACALKLLPVFGSELQWLVER